MSVIPRGGGGNARIVTKGRLKACSNSIVRGMKKKIINMLCFGVTQGMVMLLRSQ